MKKLVLILLIICYSLSYSQLKVGFVVDENGLGDNSFYDITYSGISKAQAKYGIDLYIISSKLEKKEREESFSTLIEKGVDLIVSNGINFEKELIKFSNENPDVYFLVNDMALEGPSNLQSIVYRQNEGAFLIGYLMAKMSETKKIAFIGGVPLPVIEDFKTGFLNGVKYADNSVEVIIEYIEKKNPMIGFNSPKKGCAIARELYSNGVDIIFPVAGESSNGVIQAAQETGLYTIGIDRDQDDMAKGKVLCSLIKNIDIITFGVIEKLILKGEFDSGISYYGLKEKGVGLSSMRFTKDLIPKELLLELSDLEQKIINKEIIVDSMGKGR